MLGSTHHRLVLALPLALAACGPGSVSVSDTSSEATATTATQEESTDTGPFDTSTTDPSTTDTSTNPTTTTDFVPGEDLISDPCDPFAQDCPEGEKCVPYASGGGSSWDSNKCVPILGSGGVGEPCTYGGPVDATDDCGADSHCWNVVDVDGEATGTCHAFCRGTPDDPECPPGSTCSISSEGAITLCLSTCEPLLQDCEDGLGCYWVTPGFNCIFTNLDRDAGQPCLYLNDCAAGLSCLAGSLVPDCMGAACCSGFCDLDAGDAPCEALLPGTSCVAFFSDPEATPPGLENLGVCILTEAP